MLWNITNSSCTCHGHFNFLQAKMLQETWYSCLWAKIESLPTLFNPILYCLMERPELAINGLVVHQMDACEIMKSVLTCYKPIHPKHKTLSLNYLFATSWPNYHVTLLYPRCFPHTIPRSFPTPSGSSDTPHHIWLSMGYNRVATHPF